MLVKIQPNDGHVFIVVVDGPGGSGKSTLASKLVAKYGDRIVIVHGDDFYADLDVDYRASLDCVSGYHKYFDWQRLREQVLTPASTGQSVIYQQYEWDNARMGNWVAAPDVDVLIVEGIYCGRPELKSFADLTLWVTTSEEECLRRKLNRGEHGNVWI